MWVHYRDLFESPSRGVSLRGGRAADGREELDNR